MTNTVRKINAAEAHQTDSKTRGSRRLAKFLGQLRKRKVCRAAVLYMIATWFMLQLGEIIFPALQLPDWTLTLLVVIAALEFPVAMVLAWLFELTPDGLVLDAPQGSSLTSSGTTDCVMNVALLLAAALLAVQLAWSHAAGAAAVSPDGAAPLEPDTIVVLAFSKAAGAESGVAFGLEDEIRHHLLHSATGISVSTLVSGTEDLARDSASATLALGGTVYESGDQIRLLLHLIDLKTGRYVRSVSLEATSATREDARQRLAYRAVKVVLGGSDVVSWPLRLDGSVSTSSDADKALTSTANL